MVVVVGGGGAFVFGAAFVVEVVVAGRGVLAVVWAGDEALLTTGDAAVRGAATGVARTTGFGFRAGEAARRTCLLGV